MLDRNDCSLHLLAANLHRIFNQQVAGNIAGKQNSLDSVTTQATVSEALLYSARMRLPREMDQGAILQFVDEVRQHRCTHSAPSAMQHATPMMMTCQ